MEIEIRGARSSDAPALTEIAYESKRYWGYPDHWMALWRDALTITPSYISEHLVNVAEIDRAVVAFYALTGGGLGQLFLHAAARLTTVAPGSILGIESEPNAEPFYERMGARRVREVVRDWQGVRRILPYLEFTVGRAT